MARRNDHTREQLVSLTLDTVKEYLQHNTYHSLSLRKIANMIGYVPSTLVNVFGSYNLLLLHAVAQTVDELSRVAQQATSQASDPKQALYLLATCYHEFAQQQPNRWQLLFEHNMDGENLPEWQSQRIDNMLKLLEDLLSQIQPDKNKQQVVTASRVLWAGVHGITLLSVDDKFFSAEPIDGDTLIENLITNYLESW
ncbi:TetR/AcrR family transcriptional regulator [Vibrio hippocampi]|uniref:HTH-type transcriptional regulator MT1864/Rv1816-like C-terminal domain-containing protein n=1 Tax=Vibrio hippocampi TaxID=654686 RepID=A0ABM8ZIC9_9VIBR|nr:TetR-like C-terminal domain-containing protein [Vibrio hippocampi]CAH0526579.1 hypothetical protein VHP8226_01933 [Vibrio hippocampi]